MLTRLRALLATAAVLCAAAPASAATVVSVTSLGDPLALPEGQVLVADFNDAEAPEAVLLDGFTLDLDGATVGVNEGGSGYSGTLPNNATHYLTIPGQATATLTSLRGLTSFSLFMGSPDTYNYVRFIGDGFDETLSGGQLTLGNTSQSWDWGARVNFDFGGAAVNTIILSSTGNSFEVDNFAVAAVPEPATWALMIGGFGLMGAVLRRRRQAGLLA
jgi:hypothetical protein